MYNLICVFCTDSLFVKFIVALKVLLLLNLNVAYKEWLDT